MSTETITIHFVNPQTSLTFLWGSVDLYNTLTIGNTSWTGADVIPPTGADGNQGPTGSAYVLIATDQPFHDVTFKSDQYAFEFADVRAVPDGGMTLMLLGGALVGFETLRRKFRA
ncbi:MAG: hypothetical protein IPP47_22475 [Bryobacterales bacterium]|nr:hypothetical protein [Bryobacterales bacterium]